MRDRPTALERAFALARDGYALGDIARILRRENYMDVASLLEGSHVRKQLRSLREAVTQARRQAVT